MSTVQDIFDIAIRLMDAQNESTGSTDTADTKEYRLRTPSLLNSILDRAYPASDNWPETAHGAPAGARQSGSGGEGRKERSLSGIFGETGNGAAEFLPTRRPVCLKTAEMTDEVGLDERLCTGVLPYGLAGLLLAEENPALAGFFWQTFLEQLGEARRELAGRASGVEDVYGVLSDGVEFGRFARW